MPNVRDEMMHSIDKAQAALLRREKILAKQIMRAYHRARHDLVDALMQAFSQLPNEPSASQIRTIANNLSLIRAIEARLRDLEREFSSVLTTGLTEASQAAFAQAAAEIALLVQELGVEVFAFSVDSLLELTIQPAIDQVPDIVAALRANLLSTIRERLAAGDRFSDIAQAVLAVNESVFSNGVTSAELMVRRSIIQANNNSKMLYYEQSGIPKLQKQVIAKVSAKTTKTCLRVHGQIKDLDEPFTITGKPSFGRKQMHPPFHWNCRTTVAPYLPQFENDSNLTTRDMRDAARQELRDRESTP